MATSPSAPKRHRRSRRFSAVLVPTIVCAFLASSCNSGGGSGETEGAGTVSETTVVSVTVSTADTLVDTPADSTGAPSEPVATFPGDASPDPALPGGSTSSELLPTVLESAGPFSTFVRMMTASGVATKLTETGPFTVFAPTDDAFKKLPADVLAKLLLPENLPTLEKVVKYHVIGGSTASADMRDDDPDSLEGSKLHVLLVDGVPVVNGARIVAADVGAGNGTIQGIDFVLLPPTVDLGALTGAVTPVAPDGATAAPSIVERLNDDGNFSHFLSAVEFAGLTPVLEGDGPVTVFAPDDDAFNRLPAETLRKLKVPQNKDALKAILEHHIIDARVNGRDLPSNGDLTMLDGTDVTVKIDEGRITVGSATMTYADEEAANGVIHTIDGLLVPNGLDIASLVG